ncbi:hypothetical protein DER30_2756 [Streptomyces sp. HB202]|nr:hypothetical protein DER30_2756 [Streptomyces sp. HB202]
MPSEYALAFFPEAAASPTRSRAVPTRARRVLGSAVGSARSYRRRLSRPFRKPYSAGPSISAPTSGSTVRVASGIGRPSTSAVPDVGSMRPISIRIVVVFPEPLGPRKPKTLPAGTVRSRPSTAS